MTDWEDWGRWRFRRIVAPKPAVVRLFFTPIH